MNFWSLDVAQSISSNSPPFTSHNRILASSHLRKGHFDLVHINLIFDKKKLIRCIACDAFKSSKNTNVWYYIYYRVKLNIYRTTYQTLANHIPYIEILRDAWTHVQGRNLMFLLYRPS